MLPDRQNTVFFTGIEVERTIAYGTNTLFITGTPKISEIEEEIKELYLDNFKVEHLYFGTNQSYYQIDDYTAGKFRYLIDHYLDHSTYWITLDFDVSEIEKVHNSRYCRSNRFIPMISVKMPNIQLLNYHATLKLDDTKWGHSNPGVWAHHLQSLLKKDVYTDWSEYKGDK